MFLGGMVKPGVITAPLSFNWPRNSVIDKCCEQARKETGVCVCGGCVCVGGGGVGLRCISGHSIYFRGECRGAVDYSTCFSNPSPCGGNL